MSGLKAAISHAFVGQTQRIIEACIAGGLVGASVTFAKQKFVAAAQASALREPGLPDLEPLREFDSEAHQICHELVKLVRAFLPSRASDAVDAVKMLVYMTTCYEAVVEDSQKYREVVYFAYLLAARIREIVSELSLMFPFDSPASKRATELCQGVFDLQDMLYSEIRGIARLDEL